MKKDKSSTNLGTLIDEYGTLNSRIKKLDQEVSKLKSERFRKATALLTNFTKKKLKGASGLKYKTSVVKKKHPKIKSLKDFVKYVKKNNAYDLYQNRIAPRAYMDRLKNGEKIPGTEIFESTSLNIRRVK